MNAVENCYTPKAKAVMIKEVFDIKKWMQDFTIPIHNVSNPHVFKITKDSSSDKVYLQYKNWASDKRENWKPEGETPDSWLELLKDDVEINADVVPDLVVPNLDKVDLEVLRKDVKKYFDGSRLFTQTVQDEWTALLQANNQLWNVQEKPLTWPLQDLIITKQRQQVAVQPIVDGFLGERPEAVPQDIDDMIRNQVAPIREVYTGSYRRPEEVRNEVEDYSQGHVTWDTVMPANLGYLTGLLFNQNNCAAEASTVTTKYELEVGKDLCTMVGFDPDKAMGHLVTGGTVANIESMWAARNIKYYPLGLQDAINNEDALSKARNDFTVFLPHNEKHVKIVDATSWELLNLDVDEIVGMPEKISAMCSITDSELLGILTKYAFESLGTQEFCHRHKLKNNPCSLAPTTAHVSLFKGATILGVGKSNLIPVPVDENARMDVKGLRDILEDKLANRVPVISVVAVMGTTEESAVDPLVAILEVKNEMRKRGLNFVLHADGAWGGYFCTMLRTPPKPLEDGNENSTWFVPELPLSRYAHAQLSAIPHVDTITIDPHKSGFCPYPGGATCYRDKRMNNFLGITNQVVYYHGSVNLGDVGIEGSKPGAAAAGVVMAHRVIGLHKNGYGRILGECMFTSKLLYCYWTALAEPDDPFFIVPTKPLPTDRTREEHIQYMRDHIIGKTNDEMAENDEVMEYLREIGPDSMVPCFSINIKGNKDVKLVNDIVQAVFKDLCMSDDRVSAFRFPMLVTASTYKHHDHSTALKEFKKRLGVDPYDTTGVKYIITTCMDPWATSIEFLDDLAAIMRNAILCSIGTVTDPNAVHNFVSTGTLDSKKNMIVYYSGCYSNESHQYHALAKVQFINAADGDVAIEEAAKRGGPLVIQGVKHNRVHDMLLYDFDEGESGRREPTIEVDCYSGVPQPGCKSFMRTKIRVVDVARFDHFDLNVKSYPEKSKYFLYGDKDKAFISHIPVMKPDFLQLVELESIPADISELLLNYGLEIMMPFGAKPTMNKNEVIDPLQDFEYVVELVGEGGIDQHTNIKIGRKIWFDGISINKELGF